METSNNRALIISAVLGILLIITVTLIAYFFFYKDVPSEAYSTLSDARTAYDQNQFNAAIATAEALLSQNPNDVPTLLALATAWAQRGAFEQKTDIYGATALATVEKVLSLEPHNAEAHRIIGYVYEIRGDLENAEKTYQEALSRAQNPGLLYLDLARIHEQKGNIDEAHTFYLEAAAEGVDTGRTQLGLGRTHVALGETLEAKEAFGRAHIWATNIRIKAEASYMLGTIALSEKNFTEAEMFMKRSIADDDSFALPHVGLAEIFITRLPELGSDSARAASVRSALQEIQKATDKNPHQTIAYVWAARIFTGIGSMQEALLAYQRAEEALSKDRSLTEAGKEEIRSLISAGLGQGELIEDKAVLGVSARALTAGGGGDFLIACPDVDCGIIVPPTTTTTTTTTTSGATVADSCPVDTTTTVVEGVNYTIAERTFSANRICYPTYKPPKCAGKAGSCRGGGITYSDCYPDNSTANHICKNHGFEWGVESITTSGTVALASYSRSASGNLVDHNGAKWLKKEQNTTEVRESSGPFGRSQEVTVAGTPVMASVTCKAPPPGTFFIGNECKGVQCFWGNYASRTAEPYYEETRHNAAVYMCRIRGYETYVDYWSRPKTSTAQGHVRPLKTPYPPTTPMTPSQIMAAAKNEAQELRGDPSCTSNCWYRLGIVSCKLPGSSSSSTNLPASCNLPITAQLVATPSTVIPGTPVTLTYTSTNATSCSINQGIGQLANFASGSRVVNPQTTTTYTLSCTGAEGTVTDSATVTVTSALPSGSISANPSTILRGQSSTLTWTSANTTGSTGQGFATGGLTSGTRSVSPTATTHYGITFQTAAGAPVSRTVTVTVLEPTVSISANTNRVNVGDTVTVSWNAENVESCSINGPGISLTSPAGANRVVSGSQEVVITQQSTYIISCSPSGSSSQNATIINIVPTFEEF